MSDRLFVHISDSFDDIPQKVNSLPQGEAVDFVKVVEKSSSIHVFHNQADVFSFLETSVEANDIRVIQTGMKSNLRTELIHHFVLNHFRF